MRELRTPAESFAVLLTRAKRHEAWQAETYIDLHLPGLYKIWQKQLLQAKQNCKMPLVVSLGSDDGRCNPVKRARLHALLEKAPAYLEHQGWACNVRSELEGARRHFYLHVTAAETPQIPS